jgi:hypothetical protein
MVIPPRKAGTAGEDMEDYGFEATAKTFQDLIGLHRCSSARNALTGKK